MSWHRLNSLKMLLLQKFVFLLVLFARLAVVVDIWRWLKTNGRLKLLPVLPICLRRLFMATNLHWEIYALVDGVHARLIQHTVRASFIILFTVRCLPFAQLLFMRLVA